jgi:hypothetical protein
MRGWGEAERGCDTSSRRCPGCETRPSAYSRLVGISLGADFEMSGPADAEYDLRYFPPFAPTLSFVLSVVEEYATLTSVSLDLRRVMAWRVRTTLGDALWRTEANGPLPGGGTPASYVDDLRHKFAQLSETTPARRRP